MKMQNQWKRWALGGVAALTLTAGTLWAVDNVSAASPTTSWASTLQQQVMGFAGRDGHHGPDGMGGPGFGGPGRMGQPGGAFMGDQQQYLADALGITVEGLNTAQTAARDAALKDALANGSITQEQFDRITAQQALQGYLRTKYADARPEGTMAALIEEAVTAGAITQAQADLLSSSPMPIGPGGSGGFDRSGPGGMRGLGRGGPDGAGPAGLLNSNQQQYLADALGVTLDKLQAAQETVHNTIIDQAVTTGSITQEQADQLKAGEQVPGLRLPGGPGQPATVDREALLAGALGITVEKLDAAQTAAQNAALTAAVADGKITQEQADRMGAEQALQTYVRTQYPDARPTVTMPVLIQEAVTAGAITQAQADLLLSSDGRMGPGGWGGEHERGAGGMRGPGMHGPRSQDDSTQPDAQPNSNDDVPEGSTGSST